MYKFRIKGYAGEYKNSSYYYGSWPIDATVYANTLDEALDKVHEVFGHHISSSQREIFVEELWNGKED